MGDWEMLVLRTDRPGMGGAFELTAFREAYAHAVWCDARGFADRMRALAAVLTSSGQGPAVVEALSAPVTVRAR